MITVTTRRGTPVTVRDGCILCPCCHTPLHGVRLLPNTEARNLALHCKRCRQVVVVDILDGEGRS